MINLTQVLAIGSLAIIAMISFTPIFAKLGFFRLLGRLLPPHTGLTPAHLHGLRWNYTFEELYGSNIMGQTAIVTGANSGIGYEIALALARLGVDVTMACRNMERCNRAAEKIRTDKLCSGTVTTMVLDTASLSSVKKFAEQYRKANDGKPLDMLFLNAGIGSSVSDPDNKCVVLSEDGIEKVFATNYVGHHLLYRLLEPMLQKSKMSRVVMTSSNASFYSYSYKVPTDRATLNRCVPYIQRMIPFINAQYGQSKLAQILWVKTLTRKLGPGASIYVNSFHPGAVHTSFWDQGMEERMRSNLARNVFNWIRSETMWTPDEACLTGLYLGVAVDKIVKGDIRGRHYHPQAQEVVNPAAEDIGLQDALWEFTEDLVKNFI